MMQARYKVVLRVLTKVAYVFYPDALQTKQLLKSAGKYTELCDRLADMARAHEHLPSVIDLNMEARETIDPSKEYFPHRFLSLASARVIQAMRIDRWHKFFEPDNYLKNSMDFDEKTVSVRLISSSTRDYPKFELSMSTWDGRLKVPCEFIGDLSDMGALSDVREPDASVGHQLLVRTGYDRNEWMLFVTVDKK